MAVKESDSGGSNGGGGGSGGGGSNGGGGGVEAVVPSSSGLGAAAAGAAPVSLPFKSFQRPALLRWLHERRVWLRRVMALMLLDPPSTRPRGIAMARPATSGAGA